MIRLSSFKKSVVAAGVLLTLNFPASTYADDPLFYAMTSDYDFGTLDPITGNFTMIAANVFSSPLNEIDGMGFAANGSLYCMAGAGTGYLYVLNTSSGTATLATQSAVLHGGNALGFAASPNDALYAYGLTSVRNRSYTSLYSINQSSFSATLIGNMGYELGGGLAFNNEASLFITQGKQLYGVNPITGAATPIGNANTGSQVGSYAMAFEGNILYLADLAGGIWTVNTDTGSSIKISSYNTTYGPIYALASPDLLNVPEPSTIVLVILEGLALLVVYVRYSAKFSDGR